MVAVATSCRLHSSLSKSTKKLYFLSTGCPTRMCFPLDRTEAPNHCLDLNSIGAPLFNRSPEDKQKHHAKLISVKQEKLCFKIIKRAKVGTQKQHFFGRNVDNWWLKNLKLFGRAKTSDWWCQQTWHLKPFWTFCHLFMSDTTIPC